MRLPERTVKQGVITITRIERSTCEVSNTSFKLRGDALFFSTAAKNVPEGTLECSSSFCRLLLAARKAHRTMCQKVCRYHVHRLDVL